MKLGNSLGFILFGSLMVALPALAPGLCPKTGMDGSSSRALWLDLMGTFQAAIGLGYIGAQAIEAFSVRLSLYREARAQRRTHAPIFVGSRADAR